MLYVVRSSSPRYQPSCPRPPVMKTVPIMRGSCRLRLGPWIHSCPVSQPLAHVGAAGNDALSQLEGVNYLRSRSVFARPHQGVASGASVRPLGLMHRLMAEGPAWSCGRSIAAAMPVVIGGRNRTAGGGGTPTPAAEFGGAFCLGIGLRLIERVPVKV